MDFPMWWVAHSLRCSGATRLRLTTRRSHMSDDEIEPDICRALWLSVIVQAIGDAKSRSKKPHLIKNRAEACSWFAQEDEGSDFAQTCELAGVSPADIRRVFRNVRKGEKAVDFRALKKPKRQDIPNELTITRGARHDNN